MKDLLSIINLLKRFGVFIYTGNRLDDIDLMMSEVKDLYESHLLTKEDYLTAVLILRKERSNMEQSKV